MVKLQCPNCKSENVKINTTRQRVDRIIRYRLCKDCGYRFRTKEPYHLVGVLIQLLMRLRIAQMGQITLMVVQQII